MEYTYDTRYGFSERGWQWNQGIMILWFLIGFAGIAIGIPLLLAGGLGLLLIIPSYKLLKRATLRRDVGFFVIKVSRGLKAGVSEEDLPWYVGLDQQSFEEYVRLACKYKLYV